MEKGALKVVNGDVTDPKITTLNEVVIIPHVCNNGINLAGVGVMGAGVAKALKDKWALVYDVYKKMEKESDRGLTDKLGQVCYAKVNNRIVVANMIAQHRIISDNNPYPIRYKALIECMISIVDYIRMIQRQVNVPVTIHCPKFGSELSGGSWTFILELIREIWLESGVNVVVYEFDE